MNTTSSVVLTGATVTLGRWAEGKPLSMKIVIGGIGLAIGLSVMEEVNEKLARAFATLIVVTAVMQYGPSIAYKAGLTKTKPGTTNAKPPHGWNRKAL